MLANWFSNSGLLLTLLAIPVCLALLVYASIRRRLTIASLATVMSLRKGLRLHPRMRRWKAVCVLSGLTLLGIAAAGPQWGHDPTQQFRKGRDVILVLDLSRSMNAEQPSRRERAIRALRHLAETFEEHGGNRIALIGFAARARLFFPLTQDCEHLRHTLSQIETNDYPSLADVDAVSGTRIGAALKLAVESCDPGRANRPVIVLLSDGDDPAEDDEWLEGVQAAKAKAYRVHVVSVGTPGELATIPHGRDILQFEGEPVRTKLNDERLQQIARRTDGAFLPAHTAQKFALGSFVQHLLDADDLRDDLAIDSGLPVYQLRYAWFLLPALGLFFLAMLLNESTRSVRLANVPQAPTLPGRKAVAALFVLFGISAAYPPDVDALIRQGNEAFARQDYEASLLYYEEAESLTLDPGLVAFNKAAAFHRLGRFREAIESYRRCLEDDGAPSARRGRAQFDLGNALLHQAGSSRPLFAQAVQAYRACLQEADLPNDLRADARHNLELAQLLWLKATPEEKMPASSDNENDKPNKTPSPKDTLDENDPNKSDGPYQSVDARSGNRKASVAEISKDQPSHKLHGGIPQTLPDDEPIRPLAPADTLATLEDHARRIAEERRRQRNPTGPANLATKDW